MRRMALRRNRMVTAITLGGLLLSTGCTLAPTRRFGTGQYYLIDVPACAHGIDQNSPTPITARPAISDQTIIDCKATVVGALRERMNNARLGRTAGGFIQVVTSAASAMFTGTTGASSLATATILSGTSAIIPEISEVIGAKERAEVYSKGIEIIEEAYGQYLEHLAETPAEENGSTLTPAGAALYKQIVAAVHVVESGLVGQLPSLEKMQQTKPTPLDVSSRVINMKAGSTQDIRVTQGGPLVSATSSNADVVAVDIQTDPNKATLIAQKAGDSTIFFRNASGGFATAKIQVTP